MILSLNKRLTVTLTKRNKRRPLSQIKFKLSAKVVEVTQALYTLILL